MTDSTDTLEGRLRLESFGGETCILETRDGDQWQLVGSVDRALVGQQVRVTGAPANAQFGFAMAGPVFEARGIELITS